MRSELAGDLTVERARVIAIPSKVVPGHSDSSLERENSSSLEGNVLWVETMVQNSCSKCSAKSTCGHSILSRWFSRKRQCLPVRCRAGEASLLTVGQWVEVGMPATLVIRSSLLAYGLPIVGLMFGMLLFSALGDFSGVGFSADGLAMVGATFGFVLGLIVSRSVAPALLSEEYLPRFIRAVSQSEAMT